MMQRIATRQTTRRSRLLEWARAHRRGVVSVVAMMFLILFGSLAAAMAIMSKGNIVTAATHQHVSRAMGAAETGLAIAEQRLREAAARLVVEKGIVDDSFGRVLWSGTPVSAGYGQVNIAPPSSYQAGSVPGAPQVSNISTALVELYLQDQNVVGGDITWTEDKVFTHIVALQPCPNPQLYTNTAFQVIYEMLPSGYDIRATVTGYDYGYSNTREPITRTVAQDFRIVKRVDAAVLSPSRIMIGKNVSVEGDLAALFDAVNQPYGDPLIMKSDFWGMDPALDSKLTRLFDALVTYDNDNDNRLRVGHPIEGPGIPDFGDLGYGAAEADVTQDGYVDEFDVFIMFYDADRDGRVVLSEALTVGTPAEGLTPEFWGSGDMEIDDDLGLLIDSNRPDRNRNGNYAFVDNNGNNRFDPEFDELLDIEPVNPSSLPSTLQSYVRWINGEPFAYSDQLLGFRDGFIDRRDQFSKVAGRLVFRVTESQWIAGQGNYRPRLRGPIKPDRGQTPVYFGATQAQMPDLTSSSFTNSQTGLRAQASGSPFIDQVALNLNVPVAALATWTNAMNPPGPGDPKYQAVYPDVAPLDALPDNWEEAYYEKSPYNSPTYFDWYYRPVYENMVFRNVQIPIGNNGLFKNCTFIGVTWVRTTISNIHPNWTIYGKMVIHPDTGRPTPEPARNLYNGPYWPSMLSPLDYPVLMADKPLDKADIKGDEVNNTLGYYALPDPLMINGRRVIDTKLHSNNIRFDDCIFVGGIVSDTPAEFTNTRNKLEFTGSTRFVQKHPQYPDDPNWNPTPAANQELSKSTMMLPHYSVDIGSFNSPREQDVRLRGAIIAGVLDVRGNASIDGTLLLTFKPVLGQPPLRNVLGEPIGNPALFNATIGYFGVGDGDDESLDPLTLPILNDRRLVGWDTTVPPDGLPDLGPIANPPAGAEPVYFNGYGHVQLRFNPNLEMPDGIMLPLQIQTDRMSYREGKQ